MTDDTQTMLEAIDLSDDHPRHVCHRCARTNAMVHTDSGVVMSYCRHFQVAAFKAPGRPWITREGVTSDEFFRGVTVGIAAAEQAHIEQQTDGMAAQ